MGAPASLSDAVNDLGSTFQGQLVTRDDVAYDEARRVHNGFVDKRPVLVARCSSVADVVDAVSLARDHDVEVAIRGGGHNVAGRAAVEDGLMIDLSPMRAVSVDEAKALYEASKPAYDEVFAENDQRLLYVQAMPPSGTG